MLGGIARTWFTGLRLWLIGSFNQLEDVFAAQFIGTHPVKKPLSHISLIVHKGSEFLRAYVQRFTEAIMH